MPYLKQGHDDVKKHEKRACMQLKSVLYDDRQKTEDIIRFLNQAAIFCAR